MPSPHSAIQRATLRVTRRTGLTCFALHSLAASFVFLFAHYSGDGEAVLLYMWFLVLDAPTVPLALWLESKLGLLNAMTDWWYAKGHQGVNLRAFAIVATLGGLQWFLIAYAFARWRMRRRWRFT